MSRRYVGLLTMKPTRDRTYASMESLAEGAPVIAVETDSVRSPMTLAYALSSTAFLLPK